MYSFLTLSILFKHALKINTTMNKLYILLFAALAFFACKQQTSTSNTEETNIKNDEPHPSPDWFKNANMYEVNLRQYTSEGTFKAFETHIPRLKKMGVDILWFMPITPIGEAKRKGTLGSYYAVKDYKGLNPEHGTAEDFKHMVKAIHDAGMYIMLDFVPNHSAWDNSLITEKPEWYSKNKDGEITDPIDPSTGKSWGWTDVADFDYSNKDLWKYMTEVLKFWVEEYDVDGFRCDVAHGVPIEFWQEIIPEVRKSKSIVMLAEAEGAEFHKAGFDISYAWEFHHAMNEMAKGKKDISFIDEYLKKDAADYPADATRLYFTSNHDENSWNGTEYERMGEAHKAFAVMSATLDGMPLVYTGQEAALDRRLNFFEKDVIEWKSFPMEEFYTKLLALKARNKALLNGTDKVTLQRHKTNDDKSLYAYRRIADANNEVFVALNMSDKKQILEVKDLEAIDYKNVFSGEKVSIKEGESIGMEPWGYLVLEK